jgi:hypothetical protein
MSLSATADQIVGERLGVLALLDVHVKISDITRTPRTCGHKRFSLCFLCGSHRALYCYFETISYEAPMRPLSKAKTNRSNARIDCFICHCQAERANKRSKWRRQQETVPFDSSSAITGGSQSAARRPSLHRLLKLSPINIGKTSPVL